LKLQALSATQLLLGSARVMATPGRPMHAPAPSVLGSTSQRGNDGGHSAHGAMWRILRLNNISTSTAHFPALQDSPGQVKKQIPAFRPAFGSGGPIPKANNNAAKRN
jgi:hypothetical protein